MSSFLSQRHQPRSNLPEFWPDLESARRRFTKPSTVDLYDVFCGVLGSFEKRSASGGCSLRTSPIGAPATSISSNGASGLTQLSQESILEPGLTGQKKLVGAARI